MATTLIRTKQTVNTVTTNCSNIKKTELLNEVPLKALMETKRKLPVQLWLIIGRVQWFFENNKQPEVKLGTTHRIEKFITKIEKNIDSEILIIGHGFTSLKCENS